MSTETGDGINASPRGIVLAPACRLEPRQAPGAFPFAPRTRLLFLGAMDRWGLFNYHYLARNLGVVLTNLPWINPPPAQPRFQINLHGLALWFTTPAYLPFLFALLATGGHRLRALFSIAAVWAVAVNAFGAITFRRPEYQRFYYQDASQKTMYQPD